MKATRIFTTITITLILLFFIIQPSYGINNDKENKNVYVIVINKLSLLDIEKMPNIINILDDSSLGLMNTRGASGYSGAESFATINSSDKTYSSYQSSQFHNLDDDFKEIYENRVGLLDDEFAIGNIELGRLYNLNEDNRYSPYIGALGNFLHSKGLKTAVFGNSDTDEDQIRTAALIPMDSKGLVDYGNVDNILIEDNNYPYGLKTDYNKILNEISGIEDEASLIVVDTGDLMRLNSNNSVLSDEVFIEKREMILNDVDNFLGELLKTINREESLLILLSPNRVAERIDDSGLSPIILWGHNIDEGMTISSTTNRTGIISNMDILPTIAGFLDIPAENTSGSLINSVEEDNALNKIKTINGRVNLTSKVRSKTLTAYGVISIVVMIIISSIFSLNMRIDRKIERVLKFVLLILYGLPLISILISLTRVDTLFKFILSLFIGTLIYAIIIFRFNSKKAFHFLTFLYFAIIIIDIVFNGVFTKYSVLSHDPIIGARYFGIGNESVGLFLAMSMSSLGLLYKKHNKKLRIIIILALLVGIVGHPNLGANVGGMITFLVASIFFIFEMFEKRVNIKNLIIVAIIILIAITIFGYIDVKLNPNPTHIGKSLISIRAQGIYIIDNIIRRKLLMNIRLIGTSFWTKVLFVNILVHVTASYFYKDKLNKFLTNDLKIGYLSCIVGSIVGLMVNDSGLILAAIAINMITIFLLFNLVDNKYIKNKQEVE